LASAALLLVSASAAFAQSRTGSAAGSGSGVSDPAATNQTLGETEIRQKLQQGCYTNVQFKFTQGAGPDQPGSGTSTSTANTKMIQTGSNAYWVATAVKGSKPVNLKIDGQGNIVDASYPNGQPERPKEVKASFDLGRANLSAQDHQLINAVAAELRSDPCAKASVVGKTDTSGSAEKNMKLSQQRTEAVVTALATAGVSPAQIDSHQSVGEQQLEVQTPDQVKEARNRVVAITINAADRPLVASSQPLVGSSAKAAAPAARGGGGRHVGSGSGASDYHYP
jgi:outer membrane protein OmpA-like peptidoglycan-associated protein